MSLNPGEGGEVPAPHIKGCGRSQLLTGAGYPLSAQTINRKGFGAQPQTQARTAAYANTRTSVPRLAKHSLRIASELI